ncbi:nudix hydrolase 16, mitochondrial-like [Juglans regia]|uniref:Nudix hydrolase 16, mitochondrial-like n=1 Tax=Juglans regia TaxID=51240 RepID=A0A6P9EBH0_JUGRE|nr:nudix hydrolase 16, mitochondrial-like [Juglans regia]XP_035544735.1 nudix hydrolase 16, mitochondrial-like [Juglans regia]
MSELVARTGRHQQRYNEGCRLVAGCVPFKDTNGIGSSDGTSKKDVEVLMINSTSGPGLLFPKGGWENDETVEEAAKREALEEAGVRGDLMHFLGYYIFKSKTLQDEFSPEGMCKAAMYALLVTEELQSWPEQSTRQRHWLTIPEAKKRCQYQWMRETLEEGFSKWHADRISSNLKKENHVVSPDSESELMKKAPV